LKPRHDPEASGRHAFLVASGILLSRLIGLLRTRIFAHYFGLRSDAAAGRIEFLLLGRSLHARIGSAALPASLLATLLGAAVAGAGVSWGVRLLTGFGHPVVAAAAILTPFGLVYLAVARAFGVAEASLPLRRLLRR